MEVVLAQLPLRTDEEQEGHLAEHLPQPLPDLKAEKKRGSDFYLLFIAVAADVFTG